VTPEQCRAARALVGWSIRDLATKSGLHPNAISRFENDGNCHRSTLEALEQALVLAGVQFIPDGTPSMSGGAGVRLAEREN